MMNTYDRHKARQIREESGLTQTEFAGMVGVSWVTVSRWENGVNIPHVWIVGKLLDVLNELETKNKDREWQQQGQT